MGEGLACKACGYIAKRADYIHSKNHQKNKRTDWLCCIRGACERPNTFSQINDVISYKVDCYFMCHPGRKSKVLGDCGGGKKWHHMVSEQAVLSTRGDTLMTSSFGDYESQTDPEVSIVENWGTEPFILYQSVLNNLALTTSKEICEEAWVILLPAFLIITSIVIVDLNCH